MVSMTTQTNTLYALYEHASGIVGVLTELALAGDEHAARLMEPGLQSLRTMEDQLRREGRMAETRAGTANAAKRVRR